MISIPKAIYNDMIAHAIELNPIECCGYLAGVDSEVKEIYRMANIDAAQDHFTFDPKEQFSVMKQARQSKIQLMCVYHSHPESPARLSQEDLRLLKDPNMVYIIVSLLQPQTVKAYRVVNEVVSELELRVLA
jgi:[CysO sulfur-carrier protein]-S-L-cysteine hydrolase